MIYNTIKLSITAVNSLKKKKQNYTFNRIVIEYYTLLLVKYGFIK